MQIVIDIPDAEYQRLIAQDGMSHTDAEIVVNAFYNGTPLPKGHGRLIDAKDLAKEINRAWMLWEKKGEDCYLFADVITPLLVSRQTIIEADTESEDKEIDEKL